MQSARQSRFWVLFSFAAVLCGFLPAVLAQKSTNATPQASDLIEHHALEIEPGHWWMVLITTVLVILCVLVHYEVLKLLSRFLAHLRELHRTRVLVLIWGLLITHLFEIWIYGIAYFLVVSHPSLGQLQGIRVDSLLDNIYFSFVTYTTVGYGDIVPHGPVRFLAALEALSGWVLLGWSASFTFLEMQRFWGNSRPRHDSSAPS